MTSEGPTKPKKHFARNIAAYFREYCDATSIHGFKYFGENRTAWEKLWWLTIFVICLILCTLSILTVYRKWDQSPVIVTFATKGKPICDIPFPALTVCSESKVKHEIFDYKGAVMKMRNNETLTEKEQTFLGHLSYVCTHRDDLNYTLLDYPESDNFIDVLAEVSPDFEVINCEFMTLKFPCPGLFTPMVTDDGFCYSFNILDRDEFFNHNVIHHSFFHDVNKTSEKWSFENGYSDKAGIATYPLRALLAGARYGLKFDLKTKNEKLDTLCRGSVEGFRIMFHSSTRMPRLSEDFIRVPYNRALSATIRPSQIMTSEAVKNYPPHKRQCYFPSEKKLKYFRTYSQRNCDNECLTNFTLRKCNCVIFYMPRENGTRICGAKDYYCTQKAEYDLQFTRLHNRIVLKGEVNKPLYIQESICHCMPMCTDIEYRVGSSQSVWNWSEEIETGLFAINDTENITDYHLTRVRAYFMNSNFIGSERNELYGPTDFLANFGGLLGLFTGFSILSLMEIIYFLSMRMMCNVRLYGNWAGNDQ